MIIVASSVSFVVPDVSASCRFFTAHLGFREAAAGAGFVQLSRDDGVFDIELCAGAGTAAGPLVSFTVPGLLGEYARLRAEPGLDPVLRYEPWGERSVRLTDPNGITVRLVEWVRPAGS